MTRIRLRRGYGVTGITDKSGRRPR